MKEEYGSGFDGTPEQALKYAQDTPGQELEVKRLLKIIRNKKMSKTLKIIKEVVKDKLLREQATSGWKTTVKKNATATEKANENENVGGWDVSGKEATQLKSKLRNLPPSLPEQNPRRKKQRQYKQIEKEMNTPPFPGPLKPDKKEKHWI